MLWTSELSYDKSMQRICGIRITDDDASLLAFGLQSWIYQPFGFLSFQFLCRKYKNPFFGFRMKKYRKPKIMKPKLVFDKTTPKAFFKVTYA
jgi:hypothetical protein